MSKLTKTLTTLVTPKPDRATRTAQKAQAKAQAQAARARPKTRAPQPAVQAARAAPEPEPLEAPEPFELPEPKAVRLPVAAVGRKTSRRAQKRRGRSGRRSTILTEQLGRIGSSGSRLGA